MGNSTSYLQELFKSSSILSVSQMRSSDCIYICVMAGKTDRDQTELWESVPPLFNQTIVEHTHTVSVPTSAQTSPARSTAVPSESPATTTTHPTDSMTTTSSTVPTMAYPATETSTIPLKPAATKTSPSTNRTPHMAGCPWRSELIYRRSQRGDQKETLDEDLSVNSPTISTIKLQPCVFELCKFFSQCLCRGFSQKTTLQRYCIDSHFWYEKHTVEVCNRVKRVTFSKSLKQKCLAKMCVKM
ncbi:hypothetical protein AMELA_G00217680 [Ameiurus melas]|uniref:HERV-H LTR-associating protein 1 n=1 Tax=Ameiurus melas TaxID=219545 RepID=A0A7J6A5E5_AMEME|nr:hypothetical protein AMELA_G00217680 [Ameiurus melas]